MGPRVGLDAMENEKKNPFSAPAENRTPVVQPIAYSLYWRRMKYVGVIMNDESVGMREESVLTRFEVL
jgi:hypothetical protein